MDKSIEAGDKNMTDREKQAIAAGLNYSALLAADEAFQNSWCDESTMMNEPLAIQAAIEAYRDAEAKRSDRCENCGSIVTSYRSGCPGCGAPQCCQRCCDKAEIERLTAELAQLKSVPNTIYKAVEQVLDENSAWIARPSAEVTRRVAMAAGIVWAVQLEEKLGDAFQREQLVQGLRDYIRQLEMGMDDLRAKLEAAERDAGDQKLLEYVARIAYRKGAAGIVNFDTGEHDIESTISGARKWLAEDAARGGER